MEKISTDISLAIKWKEEFLKKRGLTRPDRRDLYLYRVSNDEYTVLKDCISNILTYRSINTLHESHNISSIFVLYTAEWWKREFNGASWSWDPVLNSLKCTSEEWASNLRSDCVTKGLKSWGLDLKSTGGYRYLSNIALQGGLPIRLISESRGHIGHILTKTLNLVEKNNILNDHMIVNWIESLAHQLPKSYQTDDIYQLFARIIRTILDLKREANLKKGSNPVAILDETIPAWRDRFPMTLDDSAAQSLVEQLVKESMKHTSSRPSNLFRVVRNLINIDGDFIFKSSIEFSSDHIETQKLKLFFGIDEALPKKLELSFLLDGVEKHSIFLHKLTGHDKYHFNEPIWEVNGWDGCKEHLIKLRNMIGHEWLTPIAGGVELNDDTLWIFIPDGENEWKYLRQFSGKIAAHEALVVTPKKWQCIQKHKILHSTPLTDPCRNIYRVNADVDIIDNDNHSFHIWTGQAGEQEYTFEWVGDRIWEQALCPSLAFRKHPQPWEVQESISSQCYLGQVMWRHVGAGKNWSTNHPSIGFIEMRYVQNSEICLQNRMMLLPEKSRLELQAGKKSLDGRIVFKHWGITSAKVITNQDLNSGGYIEDSYHLHEDSLTLNLHYYGKGHPPETVDINIYWSTSTSPVKVRYPFPAKGARLFNKQGDQLQSGCSQNIHDILGMRLLVFGSQDPKLSLDDGHKKQILDLKSNKDQVEIRLIEYESHIHALLALTDERDTKVTLELDLGGGKKFQIYFFRYAGFLKQDKKYVYIEPCHGQKISEEQMLKINLYAMRLDKPSDDPEMLQAIFSEGVGLDCWDFKPDYKEAAPWVIYSGRDSNILLEGYIWPFVYDQNEGAKGKLEAAIRIMDQASREVSLKHAIDEMVQDFQHEEWSFIENLAEKLGHLPLSSMDIWRVFSRSSLAMASLALRLGGIPNTFFKRFNLEFPFMWELISAHDWLSAMRCMRQQCQVLSMESMFSDFLKFNVEQITIHKPSLNVLLAWASGVVTGNPSKEIIQFNGNQALAGILYSQLFDGEDSLRMNLIRMHSDKTWPDYFSNIIQSTCHDGVMKQCYYPATMDYRTSIINLPIFLAVKAVTGDLECFMQEDTIIMKIREHQQFDSEWFEEVFDRTITLCLGYGLLKEKT